jgi:hypothetical protein
MSIKTRVSTLSISPRNKPKIDYSAYAEKHGHSKDPFIEVEFVDEEEGFVGLYPGVADSYGVRIDRTTAASILRMCRFLHENQGHTHNIQYALSGATITLTNEGKIPNYIELIVDVDEQFLWSSDMMFYALRVVGEGLEYALEQFEASLVGRDASETAKTAKQLLMEQSKPEMVHSQPRLPKMISSFSDEDEWEPEL